MNKTQTQEFKKKLEEQRQVLRDQLSRLRGGDKDSSATSADTFGQNEVASSLGATDREMDFALDEHETAAVRTIDLALKRLEAGVYGDCMDCGDEIPLARLEASPQALRCISCQEKLEHNRAAA